MILGCTLDNLGIIKDLATQLLAEGNETKTLDRAKIDLLESTLAAIKADEHYNEQFEIILGRLRKADCTIYDRSDQDRARHVVIKAAWINTGLGRYMDLEFYDDFSAKLWLDKDYRKPIAGSWGGTMTKAIEFILDAITKKPAVSLTDFMEIIESDERAMTAEYKIADASPLPEVAHKSTYVQETEGRLRQLGFTIHDLNSEDKEKLIEIKATWRYMLLRPEIKIEFYSVGGAYVKLDKDLEFKNTWEGVISMAIDYPKKFILRVTE
ncbi:MAG: hypothetical protein WCO55_01875 [Candidatus Falkowbacteria bacterium]